MTGPGVGAVTQEQVRREVALAGLRVRACAHWPTASDNGRGQPSPIPGFVESTFSPLVADAGHRCLLACYGAPPVPADDGERTAILIVSRYGDVQSAAAVARAVDKGERVGPLMFYQSVPNAVAGHLALTWGLRGPVVCVSPAADPVAQTVQLAGLLVAEGDVDRVLVILAEQGCVNGGRDYALAALVAGAACP
jgi:3-oxoacyl-(acyl-carrier-protein) synthase